MLNLKKLFPAEPVECQTQETPSQESYEADQKQTPRGQVEQSEEDDIRLPSPPIQQETSFKAT